MEQLSPLHRDYQDLRQRTNQHTIHAKGKRLRASPSLMSLFCCREIRTLWGQLMMKKVAFICVVLVCVAVLSAGCLSTLSLIHISEPTRRTPISYAVFCLKKKKTFYN